ncbi:AAA family ATPase [Oceanimonas sp. CAM02]|uniref:AAA family ATPase n=1 Tax=Oceanimonas sp. CAM02 TaxID=3080336 RepID=UPI0029362102|nr:AAA family ATPase [Oceanimonas sp. CAM02]MDV2856303.1 AAA family ATPase [Oceanimonas sp. CAM02]
MKSALTKLSIAGFKSIRELNDFELHPLNVIVGANGAGKSNLLSFFKMLRALMDGTLNRYVRDNGGAADLLFNGSKVTRKMTFETHLGDRGFRFSLVATPSNGCAIEDEAFYGNDAHNGQSGWRMLGNNEDGKSNMVAELKRNTLHASNYHPLFEAIASWQVYHFHDTGPTAAMRKYEIVQDNQYLRTDAANIAPFLLNLKDRHASSYKTIVGTVRLAMPFFDDFILQPRISGAKEEVNLSWQQKGSDTPMQPYHLSDGSMRFICLATALLQPAPPATIVIDEPELGLHPYAITLLGALIRSAATRTQVVISTQSVPLLNEFSIEDLVMVKREQSASVLKRLDVRQFEHWLEDYSVGELWQKNILGGRPSPHNRFEHD